MMKNKLIVLALLAIFSYQVCCQIHVETLHEFNKWSAKHNKVFDPEQLKYRLSIFAENYKKIKEHNYNSSNTFQLGLNEYAHMTSQEFAEVFLTPSISKSQQKQPKPKPQPQPHPNNSTNTTVTITPIDWRNKGAVTSVKRQGKCGSCWSFSAAGLMEAFQYFKTGNLIDLSEQQLVDCDNSSFDKSYYSNGCNGGYPQEAVEYASKYGIVPLTDYPYVKQQQPCAIKSPTTNGYYPKGVKFLDGTAKGILQGLKSSPVSVLVDASNWHLYQSGIFNNCQNPNINHAVLAVGNDEQGNYIIKNSWGTTWGVNGYMILQAGETCAVDYLPITVQL
ncbi:papain family cysteine protease (macronuclear) [Tetrahymena thermophila SB210]|uniref:Papain family cysteine protease n=1 Tax=Tetrahymena thermophila (strain SB210) TaxID=312017 RepID=Q22LI0_TETTS|nr:papain family cysteine protease [Tetrahymena thermophila SB210]EAR86160.1 papain family cysteine protease [Tetrahymena thermophila SB210]|eukprot:XP_976755.1 papain family cysteine protease [Tetrahymena thermophila SB210]